VGVTPRATKHAGGLYRKTFDAMLRRVRRIESEADHLREVEQVGESGETPFVAILGVFLFLVPIVALVLGLAFAAYYLAG
jgi:nitrogen fixation/metabolism regulation signal transduction histidine kinase